MRKKNQAVSSKIADRATRLIDEASLLACAAYVDLNPIRAAMSRTLESSDYTSVQKRIEAITKREDTASGEEEQCASETSRSELPELPSSAEFLSPLTIDAMSDSIGPCASQTGECCSDKGFLTMSVDDYLKLLDWSARQVVPGKRGSTPQEFPRPEATRA